jgi:hypothetical protein
MLFLDSEKQCCGSGSYNHQAKIIRKIMIPTVFLLHFDFLSLKNYVKVPSKSFFVAVLKVNDENSRTRIRIRIRIH